MPTPVIVGHLLHQGLIVLHKLGLKQVPGFKSKIVKYALTKSVDGKNSGAVKVSQRIENALQGNGAIGSPFDCRFDECV